MWSGVGCVVTRRGRVTGRWASERARNAPPVRIHFHSGIFIYASSPVEGSGILDLSEA